MVDPSQFTTLRSISFVSSTISFSFCILAFLMYCLVRYWLNPELGKRPMFVLSLFVCVADALFAVFNYTTTGLPEYGVNPLNHIFCNVVMWGFVFSFLLSFCFTTCVAAHLYMVFVQRINASRTLNPTKWAILCTAFSAFGACVPLFGETYEWRQEKQRCWFHSATWAYSLGSQWVSAYIYVILGSIYCVFVVSRILSRLSLHQKTVNQRSPSNVAVSNQSSRHHGEASNAAANSAVASFQEVALGGELEKKSQASLQALSPGTGLATSPEERLNIPNSSTTNLPKLVVSTPHCAAPAASPSMVFSPNLYNQNSTIGRNKSVYRSRPAQRLIIYPLFNLITHLSLIICETVFTITEGYVYEMLVFEYIITGLQGFFNASLFLTDQTIQTTLKQEILSPLIDEHNKKFGLGIFANSVRQIERDPSWFEERRYRVLCWLAGTPVESRESTGQAAKSVVPMVVVS
ncbi:hypothetical protein BKA69DRAFT_1125765 [Paraphysoderma sedebokerense]|nr:hypothetical protein BKA69DRAFT_1125765 [Paraphysoderma sedebokerense]